jgi:type I restriction enzyme M protein
MYQLNSLDNPKYQQDLFSSDSDTKVKATIEDLLKGEMKRHKGFDVVLTNPPFAGEVLERELLNSYEISRNAKKVERDVLFIERCIDLMKPGGRIAIVLPHNKLGGKNFADLRQWTMQHLQVVAVIGLGRETFLPHTSQKADILIGVKRERPVKTFSNEEVLFL